MSVYIRELARELGRMGHSVDAYTRYHDLRDRQIIGLGENARLIHIKAGNIAHMHKLDIYPLLTDFTFGLENFRKREGLAYDLLHSHYWLSGRVGRWVHRLWGVPHIMMFHTLGKVKNAIGVGEAEPTLRNNTEEGLVRSCHRIIAATERERRELEMYYGGSPDRIGVVPCGVNLDLFRPMDKMHVRQRLGFESEKKIILFVGRIDPLKGIDRLLRAGAYLQGDQSFKIVVIGGNDGPQPELERLKRLSRELGIQDAVHFKGRVGQEDLPLYYNAADVFVVPSYHESFGLVALESLACGTPVVATRVGGIGGMIREGENGYLVTDDISSSMAEKIRTILSRGPSGLRSKETIRSSVSGFSWSNIARAVVDEYRSMLTGRVTHAAGAGT